MKNIYLSIVIVTILFASCRNAIIEADYNVIPLPQDITYSNNAPFTLDRSVNIVYPQGNDVLKTTAHLLKDYIKDFTGIDLAISTETDRKAIKIQSTLNSENNEAYTLNVNKDQITINGASEAGTFYGVQTLRKSILVSSADKMLVFPSVSISDSPRFPYRGAMLDVGRHLFSVDFIKKYIDLLALHNINNFHWHLTDDQGWRIEIKKYPKLTEVGSMRNETLVGHLLLDTPHRFDGQTYGGYYTQKEIKEVVGYAKERFITVIPEIDLPGHMLAALAGYPELGCTGGPYEVATKWGVFEDVLCAGNEETYKFLEGVFDEIIELFPSRYIHIGGDECPKTHWESCPKCQAKIKELGLKSDDEYSAESKLQTYVVSRVENILAKKDRKIIGWDEVLEGGLDLPDVVIMSWRGIEGGIAAAKKGHKAIMSPHYNLYLDYNQGKDLSKEPLSIGEYISLRKVYDYEPVPTELTKEEAKYIIGPQANLWTEYIKSPSHAEYMLLPRLAAVSEVQWIHPQNKDYVSFLSRMGNMILAYKKGDYNFAKHIYGVFEDMQATEKKDAMQFTLHTIGKGEIFYTLDGTVPSRKSIPYTSPIKLSTAGKIYARSFHTDTVSDVFKFESIFNKATYKTIEVLSVMNPQYIFNGSSALVDGKRGTNSFLDGNWIGFSGRKGVEVIIDMEKEEEVSSIRIGTLNDTPNWIFSPSAIGVYGSKNGDDYSLIAENSIAPPSESAPLERVVVEISFTPITTRFLKILLPGTIIPSWHEGEGIPALVFADEIEVN